MGHPRIHQSRARAGPPDTVSAIDIPASRGDASMTDDSDAKLSRAASLLDAVAADRGQVAAEVALQCLQAAELLEGAGALIAPVDLLDGDPRGSLRAAMQALGSLDDDTFAQAPVIEAARAGRRARRRLG